MRTLVRSIRTGEYLQTPQSWTLSPLEALDFRSIYEAVELVHNHGLKDMELVLGEAPPVSVPVAKLGPEYLLKPEPTKRRTARKRRLVKV